MGVYRQGANGAFSGKSTSVIINAVYGQRGKKKFSDLPGKVQTFVRSYYTEILSVE